jgi:hypothetical protein
MSISTLDDYIAASKFSYNVTKTASLTTTGNNRYNTYHLAGNIPAGTLAGTSTTAGVLITSSTAGFPGLNSIGNTSGYITGLEIIRDTSGIIILQDLIVKLGVYAATADSASITMVTHSRWYLDYTSIAMAIEVVTALSGTISITVDYVDGLDTALSTSFTLSGTNEIGKVIAIPLSSSYGVKSITGLNCSGVGGGGTFNVIVYRDLLALRALTAALEPVVLNLIQTGLPVIYPTSAINLVNIPDGATTGKASVSFEVSDL